MKAEKIFRLIETPDEFQDIASLFAGHSVKGFLAAKIDSKYKVLEKLVDKVRTKAPLALKTSEKLIDQSLLVSLDEGLALELSELKSIMGSQDALLGLSSLGQKEAPVWTGA